MSTYSAQTAVRVVAVVALLLVAPAVGPVTLTAQAAAGDGQTFAVAQGTACYVVEPVENASTNVSAFYDYRNPFTATPADTYSSYGTTDYQRAMETGMLFYADADDTSLVVVHGELGAGEGSTVTYDITGLPDGEWAVEDDQYVNRDDEWDTGGSTASIDWKFAEGRTDGGAYSGFDSLAEGESVLIEPGYNENADAWGDWGRSGADQYRFTGWTLFSGNGDEYSLALDRDVYVHAGGCVVTPPSAALTSSGSADPGDAVTFDAGGSTDDVGVVGYEWDVDGDGDSERVTDAPTTEFSFDEDGEYTVTVTAYDAYGNADTATTTVVVGDPGAPVANLSVPSSALVDESLAFDASGSTDNGSLVAYEWDFDGDGAVDRTTADPTTEFAYNATGTYEATVTVVDDTNRTATATSEVVVDTDDPPTAALDVSGDRVAGEPLTLDASGSTDDVGIANYAWDVDGDGTVDRTTTDPTTEFTYATNGTYNVSVTVTDTNGSTATAASEVTIAADRPPSAALSVPESVETNRTVTFDASGSTDDVGITTYEWDVDGDGAVDRTTETPTAEFTYATNGTYNVSVTVTDTNGSTATATTSLTVTQSSNALPTASLTAPAEVETNETVAFNASGSTDDGSIDAYEWDFDGDGDFETVTTDPTVETNYATAGTYDASVTVVDDEGARSTATATVTVTEPVTPSAALSAPSTAVAGTAVTLDAGDTTVEGARTYAWDVDGDGTFETINATSPTLSVTYDTAGTYRPTVRVTDGDGDQYVANATVEVVAVTPDISTSATEMDVNEAATFTASSGGASDSSYSYLWEFGDGTGASGRTVEHAYDQPGQYTVTMRVQVSEGASAATSVTVSVSAVDDGSSGGSGGGGSSGESSGGSNGGTGGGSTGGGSGSAGGSTGGGSGGAFGGSSGGSSAVDDGPDPDDLEPNYTRVNASVSSTELVTGDTLIVTASVANVGNGSGTKTIELEVDGEIVDTRQFTLGPNESRTVRFRWSFDEPDVYAVEVDTNARFLITVRPPQPNLTVTGLRVSDRTPRVGDEVTFTAVVRNDGRASGTYNASLSLFDETVAIEQVRVGPNASAEVTFTRRIVAEGEFTASVGNETVTVSVVGPAGTATPTPDDTPESETTTPGFGAVLAILALAAIAAVALTRRRLGHE